MHLISKNGMNDNNMYICVCALQSKYINTNLQLHITHLEPVHSYSHS